MTDTQISAGFKAAVQTGTDAAFEADWARRIKGYLATPLKEITEGEFSYNLNQMPPFLYTTHEGMVVFMSCEGQIGTIHAQFCKAGKRYFTKYVDHTTRASWIGRDEVDKYILAEREADEHSPMPKSAKLIIENCLKQHLQQTVPAEDLENIAETLHERLYFGGAFKGT